MTIKILPVIAGAFSLFSTIAKSQAAMEATLKALEVICDGLDLKFEEMLLLVALDALKEEAPKMGDIVEATGLYPSKTSDLLYGLQERNFVFIKDHPRSRRAKTVELCQKGLDALTAFAEAVDDEERCGTFSFPGGSERTDAPVSKPTYDQMRAALEAHQGLIPKG